MTGGTAEIHEPPVGEQENFVAVGKRVLIYLRLDVSALDAGRGVQRIDLNLVVEVADVRDDGLIFHSLHVLKRNDVEITSGGDVNIAAAERIFDRSDFVAFHCSLQRVDRINLGNDDARALSAQRL